jgi:hypothetical protein
MFMYSKTFQKILHLYTENSSNNIEDQLLIMIHIEDQILIMIHMEKLYQTYNVFVPLENNKDISKLLEKDLMSVL